MCDKPGGAFPVPLALFHKGSKTALVGFAVQVSVLRELKQAYLVAVAHDFLQLANRKVKVGGEQFPAHFVVFYLEISPVRECFKDKAPNGISCMLKLPAQGFYLYVIAHISVVAEIFRVVFLWSCHNIFG